MSKNGVSEILSHTPGEFGLQMEILYGFSIFRDYESESHKMFILLQIIFQLFALSVQATHF
jgi:hypothetical protein